MATPTAARAVHATLTAATVDTATLTSPTGRFAIINRGTDTISYLFGGATSADPTALGNDCFVVPGSATVTHDWNASSALVVKLISAGTPGYSIEAV